METNSTNTSIAAALRQAADLLDQHPDIGPGVYITAGDRYASTGEGYAELNWYLHIDHKDTGEQKAKAAQIVRALGGKWDKVDHGGDMTFRQQRGPVRLDVQVKREAVCERVVVGTETRTVPAVEAQPERTETVEKVEWRCQPLLADDTATAAEVPA